MTESSPPRPAAAAVTEAAAVAGRFGRELADGDLERLSRFWSLLLAWNVRINLTGATSMADLVAEHFPDSLALSRLVEDDRPLLDVGSGGGLPAIPLAVLRPELPVVMTEPRAKRAAFLRTAVRELGLGPRVQVRQERLDAIPVEGFGTLSARAVWPPSAWVDHARRFAEAGGRVVVFLSEPSNWTPPPWARVADEVRYSAGPNGRLAVALLQVDGGALTCST
jgi:16S rRNA (guanine527-N7)-methyltransferase